MGENTASDNAVEHLCITNNEKINGFQILEKIDEGAYGQVFKVTKTSLKFAMKVEPNRMDGGQLTIKKEAEIMMELSRQGAKYFPKMISIGIEPKFHYLVMTLLGENLKKLRQKSANPISCTTGTWSRIGIQCLFLVKQMHDYGILHHDIKPTNFVMGHPEDVLMSRVFHLIDFGISRKFVRSRKGAPLNITCEPEELEIRQPKKPVHSLKGTPIYTSPNAHSMIDIGRIDDIWSLLYMIAELIKPLPWDQLEGKQLEKVKLKAKLKDLFENETFDVVEDMLRAGNFYSCPNYELVFNTFKNVYDKSGCSWLDPYDWETKQMPAYSRWRQQADNRHQLFPWEYANIYKYFRNDNWSVIQKVNEKGKRRTRKKKKDRKKKVNGTDTVTLETCEEMISIPTRPNGKEEKKQKEKELKKATFPK